MHADCDDPQARLISLPLNNIPLSCASPTRTPMHKYNRKFSWPGKTLQCGNAGLLEPILGSRD